ncbi:hypothetical protein ETD83_09820 [Actinomadura soli]|uniref:Uncharacterized protein n=1 Tax=Actinomadura soli TaxID=2508997 RepID=A0A5C4JF52_9ACTN|nr:hypothetical protein [Actinomadura soli]TMR03792.1 hypothetical protein ETD83_09820 [Actinomadura soli]
MSAAGRIQELLGPLGDDENAYLRVRVGSDPELSPAELLYPMIFDPSFDRGPHVHLEPSPPGTLEELAGALRPVQVSAQQMASFLVYVCTTDIAYRADRGPWTPETARPVLESVIR